MKITMVTNNLYPCIGGVERVIECIFKKLIERGHEVKVICLDTCANSKKKLKINEKLGKIKIERIPYFDFKYYKIALGALGKVREADIIHVHGIGFFSDFLIATKFIHKKPVVVSTHGGIFHTKKIALVKNFYFNIIQRFMLRFADSVIAVSKNDLELFNKISKKNILIENGVNVEAFSSGKKEKNTFLFLGRFSKNKRVELLFDSFALLKNKINFTLFIAGTDWENLLDSYKRKCEALGIVKNVKFILNPNDEKTKELYAKSEYFVSASRYEGFGIALVEAMASGCIGIVQKNTGFANILGSKNKGYFVDFEKNEKAANDIKEIISTEKKDVIKEARKKAGSFSWDSRIDKLEKIYRELI